jgi:hypothetical protein
MVEAYGMEDGGSAAGWLGFEQIWRDGRVPALVGGRRSLKTGALRGMFAKERPPTSHGRPIGGHLTARKTFSFH